MNDGVTYEVFHVIEGDGFMGSRDEFILVLQTKDLAEAKAKVEELRDSFKSSLDTAVIKIDFRGGDNDVSITRPA